MNLALLFRRCILQTICVANKINRLYLKIKNVADSEIKTAITGWGEALKVMR